MMIILFHRGPNAIFRFPARDGTGGIWKAVAKTLPAERFAFNKTVVRIEGKNKIAHLSDGTSVACRSLISTAALDEVTEIIDDAEALRPVSRELVYSSTHVIGVGIRGTLPSRIGDKCWLYLYVQNPELLKIKERAAKQAISTLPPGARLSFLPCHRLLQLLSLQLSPTRRAHQYHSNCRSYSFDQR